MSRRARLHISDTMMRPEYSTGRILEMRPMATTLSITDEDGVTTTTTLPPHLIAALQGYAQSAISADLTEHGFATGTVADVARTLIEIQVALLQARDDDTALSA
jgi:hypothetical protein